MKCTGHVFVALAAAVLAFSSCKDAGSSASSAPATTAHEEGGKAEAPKPREIDLTEAVALHKAGARFFDVNYDDFRKENGIVEGATLVSSPSRYDVAATLPADREAALIFYCTSRS